MEDTTSLLSEPAAAPTQVAEAQTAEVVATEVPETTEAKPAEAAKPEVKAEEAAKEEAPKGAPESYADFSAPEGVELDQDVLGNLKTIAKELNLTQENAQRIVDLGVQMQQKQSEAWQAQVEKWVGEVKSDKEIGGDKLPENLGIARKAVDAFGSPELKALLDSSGLGNHPLMIKTFVNIGKAISEDGFVTSSKTAGTSKSFFDKSQMNP